MSQPQFMLENYGSKFWHSSRHSPTSNYRVVWQMFQLQFMIEKPKPDVLTLSTAFYDLSVSRNLFAKVEMPQFSASGTEGLKIKKKSLQKLESIPSRIKAKGIAVDQLISSNIKRSRARVAIEDFLWDIVFLVTVRRSTSCLCHVIVRFVKFVGVGKFWEACTRLMPSGTAWKEFREIFT